MVQLASSKVKSSLIGYKNVFARGDELKGLDRAIKIIEEMEVEKQSKQRKGVWLCLKF